VHDQDLLAALATELDGCFERLVVTYQDRLYAFALRLTGNPQDAEEIIADAFVRAYQALTRYPADRIRGLTLQAWLYQIALNIFRNRVRGRRLALVPLEPPGEGGEGMESAFAGDKAERPDAVLERAELREKLAGVVAALPERYRMAVVLRHVQGLGYGEMAAILRQPIGTIKANVHRGIRLLREALDKDQEWR